jgi:uncharacterized damage-inducible protein DinB
MQEIKSLMQRFKIWNHHLEKVANEIGEKELQYRPMPESNSAAWILVHLIGNYHEFLQLIKSEDVSEGKLEVPSEEQLMKMPFSQAFSIVQDYREAFLREIERLSEKNLIDETAPAGEDKTWRDLIYSVMHHEIYHCGQLAYIAKVLQQKMNSH